MNKIIILLSLIAISQSFAKSDNDKIREDIFSPSKVQKMYGEEKPAQTEPDPKKVISQPIFESKTCIKFIKDGETYWKNNETQVLYIEAVGTNSLKVRPIRYVKNSDQWFFEPDATAMNFSVQNQYLYTSCPKEEKQLSQEQAAKLLKKN